MFAGNISNGLIYDLLKKTASLHLEDDDRVLMITMNTGKIYVGRLLEADLDQNLDFQEMYLSIHLIKSGYRDQNTKKVNFETNYESFLTTKIDTFEKQVEKLDPSEKEELTTIFINEISKPKYLPLSKIDSLCEYSKIYDEMTSR